MTYQRAAGRCEADMNISVELALEQPVEGKMHGHSVRCRKFLCRQSRDPAVIWSRKSIPFTAKAEPAGTMKPAEQ